MHYFKALGILTVLLCGFLAGLFFAAYERRRCRQAQGFCELLRHIRVQIDCFSLPMERILSCADDGILADCGVESCDLTDFAALLSGTRLYLPQELCQLLHEFSGQLGSSYREEQLRCCDYYLERMVPLADRMREELPRRERVGTLLPMAGALALVLLLAG